MEVKRAGSRPPLWLPLHCAAARYARLRSVPRQPNPQGKEQHQENSRSSLPFSFSPCSLIKSTRLVSEMLARRDMRVSCLSSGLTGRDERKRGMRIATKLKPNYNGGQTHEQ